MKKTLLFSLLISTSLKASEKNYFECVPRVINELHLPFKGTFDVEEHQRKLGSSISEDRLKIYDILTLKEIESYDVSDFYVLSVSFSPDNRFILIKPVRKNIKAILIDRKNKDQRHFVSPRLEWLSDNLLGEQRENADNTNTFITFDPVSLRETTLSTPGLDNGFWYNFTSKDADLISTSIGSSSKVLIYSLKNKTQQAFQFEGVLKEFNLKKNFAIVLLNESKIKKFSVIRLSDMKEMASLETKIEFSHHLVGDVLYLQDYFGFTNIDKPDRREYQRIALDLKTGKTTHLDYIGPWQSMTPVDDTTFSLQVIDSSSNRADNNTYYAIFNNDWKELLKVKSPDNGFTFLHRLDQSSLFSLTPSTSYKEGKKYEGQIGIFNILDPDRINYYFIGDQTLDDYKTYAPRGDRMVTTSRESIESKTGPVLKLWQLNENCAPTEYRF